MTTKPTNTHYFHGVKLKFFGSPDEVTHVRILSDEGPVNYSGDMRIKKNKKDGFIAEFISGDSAGVTLNVTDPIYDHNNPDGLRAQAMMEQFSLDSLGTKVDVQLQDDIETGILVALKKTVICRLVLDSENTIQRTEFTDIEYAFSDGTAVANHSKVVDTCTEEETEYYLREFPEWVHGYDKSS